MNLCIIIPAYNEEKRIEKTLQAYAQFFSELEAQKMEIHTELLVVLNGCKDNTLPLCKKKPKNSLLFDL